VDDGSTDATWSIIENVTHKNKSVMGIKLSRNEGHQKALLAGLLEIRAIADAAISIDADLQDDTDVIDRMVRRYREGYEVVYGVRSVRETDSFFKRVSAQSYYKLMRALGAKIIYNHADFRLLGKKSLDALSEYKEVNLFLRGIVPLLGFESCIEYYERKERLAGESKYPLLKMLGFALEGITSFSIKPIRFISYLGLFLFTGSAAAIIYFFVRYFTGHTVAGWASLACSVWGTSGLTLFAIGVVGEYIGKIYLETKHRPLYHIESVIGNEDSENA
jgi:glycosyltransferase involved in cell wall biosynthesis